MSEYLEHDKLLAIQDQTQAIGEFVNWMAARHRAHFMRFWCGEWHQAPGHLEQWLAEWAGIDRSKLEIEKRVMLERLRELKRSSDDASTSAGEN